MQMTMVYEVALFRSRKAWGVTSKDSDVDVETKHLAPVLPVSD